jgi:hypothetical protein
MPVNLPDGEGERPSAEYNPGLFPGDNVHLERDNAVDYDRVMKANRASAAGRRAEAEVDRKRRLGNVAFQAGFAGGQPTNASRREAFAFQNLDGDWRNVAMADRATEGRANGPTPLGAEAMNMQRAFDIAGPAVRGMMMNQQTPQEQAMAERALAMEENAAYQAAVDRYNSLSPAQQQMEGYPRRPGSPMPRVPGVPPPGMPNMPQPGGGATPQGGPVPGGEIDTNSPMYRQGDVIVTKYADAIFNPMFYSKAKDAAIAELFAVGEGSISHAQAEQIIDDHLRRRGLDENFRQPGPSGQPQQPQRPVHPSLF